jgi:hypothetical protein
MFSRVLFVLLGIVFTFDADYARSSSGASPEDDFHMVDSIKNRDVECLFPEKFTPQQMGDLFQHKSTPIEKKFQNPYDEDQVYTIPVGTIKAGKVFYEQVMPYKMQILSGYPSSYAARTHFIHRVQVIHGNIYGGYEYNGAGFYQWARTGANVQFAVKLELDNTYTTHNLDKIQGSAKLYNLRESILGQRDFISSPNKLNPANFNLPEACLYNIFMSLDETWISRTGEIQRLVGHITDYLLLLDQLRGSPVFEMTVEQRQVHGDHLYASFLSALNFGDGSAMTIEKFKNCAQVLRFNIFSHLGIQEADFAPLVKCDKDALGQGKIFIAVPDTEQ